MQTRGLATINNLNFIVFCRLETNPGPGGGVLVVATLSCLDVWDVWWFSSSQDIAIQQHEHSSPRNIFLFIEYSLILLFS